LHDAPRRGLFLDSTAARARATHRQRTARPRPAHAPSESSTMIQQPSPLGSVPRRGAPQNQMPRVQRLIVGPTCGNE